MTLKAVNGTKLKCYGYKEVSVRINRKKYDIRAIKTDVENPILGWNFVRKHRLTLDWSPWGDAEIIDKRAKIKQVLKYKAIPVSQPRKLSKLDPASTSEETPVTSHAFAFETACMAALEEELDTVINDLETMPESEFKDLIKKYPDILKLNFDTEDPKNGIIHKIDTANHPPCKSRVRKLLPGSQKEIEGEKAINQLLKLGIIEKVDPNDPVLWSSPLHLPPKADGSLRVVGDYRLLNQKM